MTFSIIQALVNIFDEYIIDTELHKVVWGISLKDMISAYSTPFEIEFVSYYIQY